MMKYVLLYCTSGGSNKFYEMFYDGKSSKFTVKYGRKGAAGTIKDYSISEWHKKYNEKINKNYYVAKEQSISIEEHNNQLRKLKILKKSVEKSMPDSEEYNLINSYIVGLESGNILGLSKSEMIEFNKIYVKIGE